MNERTQAKAPTNTIGAQIPMRAVQPQQAVPECAVERLDISVQLASASQLGHNLGAIGIIGSAPSPFIQCHENLQTQSEPENFQRQDDPEEEKEDKLQTKPDVPSVGLEGGQVPATIESAIHRARGGGRSLDDAVQEQMSGTLGHDFSNVRVHSDTEADALNKKLSAKAFTTGQDIFFRHGTYDPASSSGRKLIGHELTHVLQQSSGQVSRGGSGMMVRPANDLFEQEADSVARNLQASHIETSLNRLTTQENQVAQRDCWEMDDQTSASFVEGGMDGHIFRPDQIYWRMQPTRDLYNGQYFAPVIDNLPDVWKIAEDQVVTAEERSQLAVKYGWVQEWKFLVLYKVEPNNPKERPYGGIAREQPRDERMAYSGGAYQAVFPRDRTAEILAIVPVYEVGAEETRAQPQLLANYAQGGA